MKYRSGARRSNMRVLSGFAAGSALLSLSGHQALAQEANTSSTASSTSSSTPGLQEVVVTGSLIKRADMDTPSPVQVITPEQIQNASSNPGPTSCQCDGQGSRQVTVSATVTNTGQVAGSEVAQL